MLYLPFILPGSGLLIKGSKWAPGDKLYFVFGSRTAQKRQKNRRVKVECLCKLTIFVVTDFTILRLDRPNCLPTSTTLRKNYNVLLAKRKRNETVEINVKI